MIVIAIRWRVAAVLGLCTILAGPGRADADYVVSVTINNGGPTSIFGTLDLTTGQYTSIANLDHFVGAMTVGPDGTLYAATDDGYLNKVGPGGVLTQYGSGTAVVHPGGTQYGYYGLVDTGAGGFLGLNESTYLNGPGVDRISPDGNTITDLVTQEQNFYLNSSGGMSYGPDGNIYVEARGFDVQGSALFRLDPTTGHATELNMSGLGVYHTHDLALATVGGQLYGVDSSLAQGPASHVYIYTINTTTGVATMTGVQVTGLPDGYNITAIANALVPEPSSIAMAILGGSIVLLGGRARRGRATR